jgi:hypothetical protein
MGQHKDKYPSSHPYSIAKFRCPCCNSLSDQYKSVEKFQRLLEHISDKTKKFWTITSAFRCLTQNKKVGGADKSDHLSMLAIDIAYATNTDLFSLVSNILNYQHRLKYRYIRIYKNHVHVSLESPVANAFDKLVPGLNRGREPILAIAW